MPDDFQSLTMMNVVEFAQRMAASMREHQQRYTWFLGAGCSVSSGIDAATGLVNRWLDEICDLQPRPKPQREAWAGEAIVGFDAKRPWLSYAPVFARRHPSPADRQREIETICQRGEPSYGYATFAQLLSHPEFGRLCNTVLTTNFDDLIADALYVYGDRRARPQIITHEALARYVRINSPRPTVVKLHGDAHLDPKNLEPETARIQREVSDHLHPLLRESALVFVGYGGNDESILRFLSERPDAALEHQVYWVGKTTPSEKFVAWLAKRRAIRVDHRDFDRLMHLLRGAFKLEHPDAERWKSVQQRYLRQYEEFEKEIAKSIETAEKAALRQATEQARPSLESAYDYLIRAASESDPEKREAAYREGIDKHPKDADLLGSYANFLTDDRRDHDGAERLYKRAIEAEPKDAINLGNYAIFLREVRGDPDGAENYFKRAIEADPKDADYLGSYANFLIDVRKDYDRAAAHYKRAIEANPKGAIHLSNYAIFLQQVKGDLEGAEAHYKRAIEADPKHANGLCNYAQLKLARGHRDEGLELLRRAFEALPKEKSRKDLFGELLFYLYAHAPQQPGVNLAQLKALVAEGGRSPGWDFSPTIQRAIADGHPAPELLKDLAEVLTNGADAAILDRHGEWRAAGDL